MSADASGRAKKALYRFDHAKFNISLPPQTMWMNVGFWKGTEDFPTACQNLLEELLGAAHILRRGESDDDDEASSNTLSIIDLGFGCGDQSLYMKNVMENQIQSKSKEAWNGQLTAYVGITLDEHQFGIAQDRLGLKQSDPTERFQLHCADAAKPESWKSELREAVALACTTDGKRENHESWLIALDTIYHFRPSRWPIIEHACHELNASFVAFDLCISEDLSLWNRIVLWLISFLGQIPFINWLTVHEYRERLVKAGYARDKIEIREVTEHVFRPLARFLRRREVELEKYGMSIGRFRHGASMFDWCGKSGVVRGCIVVARK